MRHLFQALDEFGCHEILNKLDVFGWDGAPEIARGSSSERVRTFQNSKWYRQLSSALHNAFLLVIFCSVIRVYMLLTTEWRTRPMSYK